MLVVWVGFDLKKNLPGGGGPKGSKKGGPVETFWFCWEIRIWQLPTPIHV